MAATMRTKDDTAFAPGQVLRVYGMRRSGNHALINWIMRNAKNGHGLFLNNCRPGQDPLLSASNIELFENGQEVDIRARGEKVKQAGTNPFTVVSYEDRMPPPKPASLYQTSEQLVIIYRSFLHWAASLLRKIQGNPGYDALDRHRIMARSVGTYSDMLTRIRDTDVVPLCYDAWVTHDAYRAQALKRLGLPGRDLSLGGVQRYGGGSSFQDATRSSDLQTNERSAQMSKDHEYLMLLWTAARDRGFLGKLGVAFPKDAERLETLGQTAKAEVKLP